MLTWFNPITVPVPEELVTAEHSTYRHCAIDRYRSRTTVTPNEITSAYAWTQLPTINGNSLVHPDATLLYITRALSRGAAPEQTTTEAMRLITNYAARGYKYAVITYNTATNAAAAEALRIALDNAEHCEELQVRTIVTTTPNHKIRIYKYTSVDNFGTTYVILNNLDNATTVLRNAIAIMLDTQPFDEAYTNELASAYLSADADKVCETIRGYYAEYNQHKQEYEFKAALEALEQTLNESKDRGFVKSIQEAQDNIDKLYDELKSWNELLNNRKAKYLLHKLTYTDKVVEELKQFLISCRENLPYVKYTNNKLCLVYKTPLLYFEPQSMQRYFDSTRQNVVTDQSPAIQQLIKDIFINQTHRLLFETGAELNLNTGDVHYLNPATVIPSDKSGIPNPHHHYYDCWGDNRSIIIRALNNHEYINAIMQTFAAMAGVNVVDTAVVSKLVNREFYEFDSVPCIKVLETNETITISEYTRRYNDASNEND